ncbi:hypothetical protein TNCV_4893041 [Trichonephila clavipes]|nr:hypothetical protein TNCV_4893041 [Trichonephila clavipes]
MLWGGKLLVETILRQTRTPSSMHSEEWDKLPQQLLDNVLQSMPWSTKLALHPPNLHKRQREKFEPRAREIYRASTTLQSGSLVTPRLKPRRPRVRKYDHSVKVA